MSLDWILERLGIIHKNAHELAMKTNHPTTIEIVKLCNELAEQYGGHVHRTIKH